MNATIIPALYINVTGGCNLKCLYCPEHGENWEPPDSPLPLDQLVSWVQLAAENGLTPVRITGGEPMLFPDRVRTIVETLNAIGFVDIILNTNGFNTAEHVDWLAGTQLKKVKISLDSIDSDTYKRITGKPYLPKVLNSIEAIRHASIPLELNAVVTRASFSGLWRLISFCSDNEISLKLLNLVKYPNDSRAGNDLAGVWEEQNIEFDSIIAQMQNRFGSPSEEFLSSGRGVPMQVFSIGKHATLTVKASSAGSTYGAVCIDCNHLPCGEGLFHVSTTASGQVRPCRLRNDLGESVRNMDAADMKGVLDRQLLYFTDIFRVEPPRGGGSIPERNQT